MSAEMDYKFSFSIGAHSGDVRALAVSYDGNLLSGSRDCTAKVWKRTDTAFVELAVLHGHANYVSSLLSVPPTEDYPNGVLLTGSHDTTIRMYQSITETTYDTIGVLNDHSGPVTSLKLYGNDYDRFISCSFDGTIKIWSLKIKMCVRNIEAGSVSLPIWDILLMEGKFLIGASADRTVKVFSEQTFDLIRSLAGHEECVRALAPCNKENFFSAANDGKIIKWNAATGQRLKMVSAHTDYIYHLFSSTSNSMLLSSGEGGFVALWLNANNNQILLQPTTSVWTTVLLPNDDVASGGSDGVIRIFSRDPARMAHPLIQESYDESVNLFFNESTGENTSTPAAPEDSLRVPGVAHGDIKMVKQNGVTVCYMWNASAQTWQRVGDVMGASNPGGEASSMESTYDYTFKIDVGDNQPQLNLYYNRGQDPTEVAAAFIESHRLPMSYLEPVVNHILTNIIPAPLPTTGGNDMNDPLTGQSRYVPAASTSTGHGVPTRPSGTPRPTVGQQEDLFSEPPSPAPSTTSCYIPQTSYVLVENADLAKIRAKLAELGHRNVYGPGELSDEVLNSVVALARPGATISDIGMTWLRDMLHWRSDIVFPVLDVLRLAVRNAGPNRVLCSGDYGKCIFDCLRRCLASDSIVNIMFAFRIMSNMVVHETGAELMMNIHPTIFNMMIGMLETHLAHKKRLQTAVGTFLLNMAVLFTKRSNERGRLAVMSLLNQLLPSISDEDALSRFLVGIGTLIDVDYNIPENNMVLIRAAGSSNNSRLNACANELITAHTEKKLDPSQSSLNL